MQAPDSQSLSTSRRPLDIEDYLQMVRRHAAWILGPAFAGLVVAVVVAFLWPDTYVSSATLRVVPPQVPENLVAPNVNSAMAERINSMYQTISSRTNLTNLINSFNLYQRERQRKPIEDVVEEMRRAIKINSVVSLGDRDRNMPAFQISYSYENRILAQKVAADLVGRFMAENTRERTTQSISTTVFLRDQLESAKRDLDTIDQRVSTYRQTYQGRLPEQTGQNQMQISMLEQRIGNINNALARVSQEKLLMESDLRSLKTQRASLTPTPESLARRHKSSLIEAQDREILQLETLLANLRQHYKDNYPDVQRVIAQLGIARKTRDKIASQEETDSKEDSNTPKAKDPMYEREGQALDASIQRIETQLKAKSMEADTYQKDMTVTENQIRQVQERIQMAPSSEQQYAQLIRDQMLAKQTYEELNRKRSQSAISEELERRQQGERLELLDAASLPQTPTEPKRVVIIGAGLAMGLVIGLALAGAREAKDTTLKNLKDVRAYTRLNVLGSIPLLENDVLVRHRRRLAWLAWSTACLAGIIIMTGAVFYYYSTKV